MTGGQQERQWAMFIHFSILAGLVVPLAGLILPIVLWQVKKTEFPTIDAHGKRAVNWIISAIIYSIIGGVLSAIVIGIPILIAVGVLSIVFPILAGIKANNGELWDYPLTIRFLK